MSAYCTERVTRNWAIRVLIEGIMKADDKKIAELLFEEIGYKTLRNFIIVEDEHERTYPQPWQEDE